MKLDRDFSMQELEILYNALEQHQPDARIPHATLLRYFSMRLADAVYEQPADACPQRVYDAEPAHPLQRFKAYVHERLDAAGVPTHPNGPHSAKGCRIGDRLDIVLAAFDNRDETIAQERAADKHHAYV